MSTHLYRIGSVVYMQPADSPQIPGARAFKVEAQMPPVGTSLQYRIKSEAEPFSRVVPEHLVSRSAETTASVPTAPHRGEQD